jgi:uncharacterized protein YndB with AHSA1/START domain
MSDRFIYVTYIRTSQQKLWDALLKPEFQRLYWFGAHHESEWKKGAAWKIVFQDGRIADSGEVLEIDPPNRLVLKWRNEWNPEIKAEGYSRCEFNLEPAGDTIKLTVTHSMEGAGTKFIQGVSGGWPKILSSLKSLLETGNALPETLKKQPAGG